MTNNVRLVETHLVMQQRVHVYMDVSQDTLGLIATKVSVPILLDTYDIQ